MVKIYKSGRKLGSNLILALLVTLCISTSSKLCASPGTVIAWGDNSQGQTNVPPELTNVVAIACGYNFSLALTQDGVPVAWGNPSGVTNMPTGLTNVTAIAAGLGFGLVATSDGKVLGWGNNDSGQASPPADLTNVVALAAGENFSMALKQDGTVTAWGYNGYGQLHRVA